MPHHDNAAKKVESLRPDVILNSTAILKVKLLDLANNEQLPAASQDVDMLEDTVECLDGKDMLQ